MGEKGEGIKKYKLVVTEQSWGVKYSIGSIVSNTVITMCGARWVLEMLRRALYKVYDHLTIKLYT